MGTLLTILGLGPGNPAQRTLEAVESLKLASTIVLRTAIHPGLAELASDHRVESCDRFYESGRSFQEVYAEIVAYVLARAAEGDLVYAVPGHPLIGERTVTDLLEQAAGAGIQTRIVDGISAIDVVASALGIDPMAGEAQLIDASELHRFIDREPFNGALPDVSPARPVLLSQVYSSPVASSAKLALSGVFPDDHEIVVVSAAAVPGAERIRHCRLFELDRIDVNHLTSVWIPRIDALDATRWPVTLHRIAARLRAPGGCPWDREQTHASLRGAVIEEAYEVAAAIDESDPHHLAEELGDLLLHVAMQAQIAEEQGEFSIGDVYDHVNRKLVRRHPHVFGDVSAETPDAVVQTWDAVKAAERAAAGSSEREGLDPFDRLPRSMPVLHRVAKTMKRRRLTATDGDDMRLGDELLLAVEQLAAAGLDPEHELERAYRRRPAELVDDSAAVAVRSKGSDQA